MSVLPREGRETAAAALAPRSAGVLLDPGHGLPDGGAVAADGTLESGINLEIALCTRDLMTFCGIPVSLTRTGTQCLCYDPAATIRQNKISDIRERLRLARSMPDRTLISIHLNQFHEERYSGAQVFYSPNAPASGLLAQTLQKNLIALADPENDRVCKKAPDTVYLMRNLQTPAVIAECGFLSNRAELEKLKTPEYRRRLALAITAGYLEYIAAE